MIADRLKARLGDTDRAVLQSALAEVERLQQVLGGEPVVEQYKWLTHAYTFKGLEEVPGSKHHPQILTWWERTKQSFRDDETPWCAAFIGGTLEETGHLSTRKANARSYIKWGQRLHKPAVGCVVTFWRGKKQGWKGHVGYVVGKDTRGNLLVLGGNQGNSVSVKAFPKTRILSYSWPTAAPKPTDYTLPVGEAHMTNGDEA